MAIRDLLIGAALGLVILALASAALIEPQETLPPDLDPGRTHICSPHTPADSSESCRVS